MPFIKVYIHCVWSTKNRFPYFENSDIRHTVWAHIRKNAESKGIYIDIINGYWEHCHCIIALNAEQTISGVIKLLKGESSYWINKQNFFKGKFEWQDEYFSVSISESMVHIVRDYIKNQETHHQKKSFADEINEFIEKYKFNIDK
jgi:putative transposase